MIKATCILTIVTVMAVTAVAADRLSRERQVEIIQNYLLATGQTEALAAFSIQAGEIQMPEVPIKCGTPAVMEFVLNRDKFDADLLKSLSELVADRPTNLPQTITSPSGRFEIHFTTSGTDRIWDGLPGTGYADSVAKIYDEVYTFLVNTLGYPDPPGDGFYASGGTDAFDVYLVDLGGAYYGLTYLDSIFIDGPNTTRATAFQIIDNDYAESAFNQYPDPLMAVRVTCAHEFFHVVHFGIDFTEGSISPDDYYRSYLMEMTATWMEEEMYDDINDYYGYLPFFFREPAASIQRFLNSNDLHPYASMLYPLFISQRYDRDLIRDIWIRCAEISPFGDDFPEAAEYVIDTLTNGTESFASVFQEFTLWNYFTGSRSSQAPAGIGYEERANYPEFEDFGVDSVIAVYRNYSDSIVVDGPDNPFSPQHNGAFYMRLDELQTLEPDTTYWLCIDGTFPACNDSMLVLDPADPYDIVHVDSTFSVGFTLDSDFPYAWGLNIVYRLDGSTDTEIEELTLADNFNDLLDFYYGDLDVYGSMAFILTPASSNRNLFSYVDPVYDVGYQIGTENAVIDSSLISIPAAVLSPYPNPVVVNELDGAGVKFKFQVPTDDQSFPLYAETSVSLYVDIFTVAGEHIRTLNVITDFDERRGEYETEWNLMNSGGEPAVSGVYLAYARLFGAANHTRLLAEGRTKVLVIR